MSEQPVLTVFRDRGFPALSISHAVAQFGDKIHHRALIFLVGLLAAHSPAAYAELAMIMTLPVLLFAPLSGVCVDRWNRKRVMVFCHFWRGLLVLFLPAAIALSATRWPLLPLVFFVFLLGLFQDTARLSLLPAIVPHPRLLGANSVDALFSRISSIAGFVLADLLVAWPGEAGMGLVGWQASFLLAGVAFMASAGAASTIPTAFGRPSGTVGEGGAKRSATATFRRSFRDVAQVVVLMARQGRIRWVMASVLLLTVVSASVYVLGLPIVQKEFPPGVLGVGALASLMGIGTVLGSFLCGTWGERVKKSTLLVISYLALGLCMIGFSHLHSFSAAAVIIAFSGITLAPILIAHNTLLHETLPEEIRGKGFGMREWLFNSGFLAAAGVIGLFASYSSARAVLRTLGILVFTVAVVVPASHRTGLFSSQKQEVQPLN